MIREVLCDVAAMHTVLEGERITVSQIKSGSRKRSIAAARHTAAWLLRHLTPMTYDEVAQCIGVRDHTSVMYGIEKVEHRIGDDPLYAKRIADIITRYERDGFQPAVVADQSDAPRFVVQFVHGAQLALTA